MSRSLLFVVPLVLLTALVAASRHTADDFVRRGDAHFAAERYTAAAIEYRNAIKKNPAQADIHRKLADSDVELGKLDDAFRAYARAVELDATDVRSRVEAGRLLFGSGHFAEALLRAEQALARDGGNVEARILAGRVLTRIGRLDEAVSHLNAAIARYPRPAAYAALADAQLAAGDPGGAEASLRAAVAAAPESVEAHVALARYLASDADHVEAEREFLHAVAAGSSSEMANRAAASFYLATGRDTTAERFLKNAAAQPNQKLKSSLALADYYAAAHRYAEARAVLEPLFAGTSADAARIRLAAIELESGSPAHARRLIDDALKRRPSADAQALNAQLLSSEGKQDEALAAARAAIALDPRVASAQYVLGSIELARGHFEPAERALRQVLRQNRLTREARLQLARATLATGRPLEAREFAAAAGPSAEAQQLAARAQSLLDAGPRDRR